MLFCYRFDIRNYCLFNYRRLIMCSDSNDKLKYNMLLIFFNMNSDRILSKLFLLKDNILVYHSFYHALKLDLHILCSRTMQLLPNSHKNFFSFSRLTFINRIPNLLQVPFYRVSFVKNFFFHEKCEKI